MLFWLGSFVLAAVGGWLFMRGLFGHRRIVSKTRRCPRCRYDMTGRPGEMTCAECGFTARFESQWYGGRRWLWPIVLGAAMLVSSLGLGSWPITRETGYLALLPVSVQVRVWPSWVRLYTWMFLGSEIERDGLWYLARHVAQADSRTLERAFVRSGIAGMRASNDRNASGEIARVLGSANVWPEADVVSESDVLFLLSHEGKDQQDLGVSYMALVQRPSANFASAVEAVCSEQEWGDQRVEWVGYSVDRQLGFERVEATLRSDDPASADERARLANLVSQFAYSYWYTQIHYPRRAQAYEPDFLLAERLVLEGQVGIVRKLFGSTLGHTRFSASAADFSMSYAGPLDARIRSLVDSVFDKLASPVGGEVADTAGWLLQNYSGIPIRLATSRLQAGMDPGAAERIIEIARQRFESAGSHYAADGVVDLERFAEAPGAPVRMSTEARRLAREIRAALPEAHDLYRGESELLAD